jgi:hypothetical protein
MNENMIRKSRWFWPWQDNREETWLGEMAARGLHLQKVGYFGRYTFIQGTPSPVAYRLDFVTNTRKTPDYFQLFRDAGWEHAGEMGGWQYWRKEYVDGKAPEIFTDNASKVQKYQRLLGFIAIFFPIFMVNVINYGDPLTRYRSNIFIVIYESIFFVFFAVMMLLAYSALMIVRRISELKQKG